MNKNPDFADLDKNGIVDAAHARLLDVILADTTDVNYCCIRGAYDQNLALANAYADEVQAVQPVVFMMIPRTDVVPAVAGVMTLGEAATIAIITDQFDNAPIDIPSINISAFDRSSEKYLAFNGDADLDGVCNLGEYAATVDWIDDFDAFVAAARDPLALADGGGCPSCEGEAEGALQEGEGGGEGETEGASIEGEGGGEGEGEGEGIPAEGEGGLDCLTFTSADVPVTINDMMQANSTITVADDFIISDVNVMLDITHPAPGELTVWLMSPSATSIFLTIQRGGSGANFTQTIFDDQASVMIGLGTPPFTGRFIPDDTLSDLNGENAQGEWALIMFDGGQGNTGTLNGWSIAFNNVCDFPGEGEVEGSISEGTPEEGEGSASEGEGNLGAVHSADWNGGPNGRIDLSELLRIIQFYNSGVFHCQSGTEDGYAPGSGDQSCAHHSGDYGPQDWSIGLSELLRIIQFYNSTGYHACTGSEDGFCPGQA